MGTVESIEDRLHHLRTQQQEAARRYAQAEAKRDEVLSRKNQILESLSEQGFDSPDEARQEVERLTSEVEDVLAQIEEKVKGL